MAVIKLRGDVRAHKQGSFRQGHTFRNSSQRTKFFINFRARSSNMIRKSKFAEFSRKCAEELLRQALKLLKMPM